MDVNPLGGLKSKFTVFLKRSRGAVCVFDEGVQLSVGKTLQIRNNYVVSVEGKGKLPLNKTAVDFIYYDMFGNKEVVSFAMISEDFNALKHLLGK